MSITDPLIPFFNEKRQVWILTRGPETYYDENRILREWETLEEAVAWAESYLKETPRPPNGKPIKGKT